MFIFNELKKELIGLIETVFLRLDYNVLTKVLFQL